MISSLLFKVRLDFLRTKGLCFGCLRLGHQRFDCRCKATCGVCMWKHPIILHRDAPSKSINSNEGTTAPAKVSSCMKTGQGECTFAIVPVMVHFKNSCTSVLTYAFLDNGSNVSFCSERLRTKLGAAGKKMDRIGYLFQNCVQDNNSWSQKQRENNNYYIL